MGVEMLRRADLSGTGTGSLTAALALTAGLLPLLTPDLYAGFPAWARTILGSGVVSRHTDGRPPHRAPTPPPPPP